MPEIILSALTIIELLATTAIAIIAALITRGFIPIICRPDGSAVWHLGMAVMAMEIGIASRAGYWASVPTSWRAEIGQAPPNVIFSAVLIWGGYHMLRVLLLIIPEEDRGGYSLITAPFYPGRWRDRFARTLGDVRRRMGR